MGEAALVEIPAVPQGPPIRQLKFDVRMAMGTRKVFSNIRKCRARKLPSVWNLPEVYRFKGDQPLALVGGGPSLTKTLDTLKSMRTIMVCGSAHDHLISLGIVPRYCVLSDPDEITADYVRNPHPLVTYLVASQCHPVVFDRLEKYAVAIWHCAGVGTKKQQAELFGGENAIGGGSTVMLRAINIGIAMGYGNQHFFGMDSCFSDGAHHAYAADDDAIRRSNARIVDVRLPGSNRIFFCAPYMAAQAEQFQGMLKRQGHLFTPTIHGDGLVAEIMRIGQQKAQELANVSG